MAIITFYNANNEETGKTSSLIAIDLDSMFFPIRSINEYFARDTCLKRSDLLESSLEIFLLVILLFPLIVERHKIQQICSIKATSPITLKAKVSAFTTLSKFHLWGIDEFANQNLLSERSEYSDGC